MTIYDSFYLFAFVFLTVRHTKGDYYIIIVFGGFKK